METKEILKKAIQANRILAELEGTCRKLSNPNIQPIDPLIVMSLMHYQFEAIHPFADGNGCTGRIINVLYLVNRNLLTEPVLYLSSYIIQHKAAYYRTLREGTEEGKWIEFVLFMLEAVAETAQLTLQKIDEILNLQQDIYDDIRQLPQRLPFRELSEILFSYPYTKIRVLEDAGLGHRQTAAKYLQILSEAGIVKPINVGRENYYINHRLMDIFSENKPNKLPL
ncbi:MAG: Fic family protein [Bacteroidia bacterium]